MMTPALEQWWKEYGKEGWKVFEQGAQNDAVWFRPFFLERGCTYDSADLIDTEILTYKKLPMEDMKEIKDNTYDLVFVCHSWEHCERPVDALKEFKRILKPNGWVFLATPSPCEKQITAGDRDHIFVLNPMQMTKLLVYVGFKEGKSYLQDKEIELVQDYNVITTGRK